MLRGQRRRITNNLTSTNNQDSLDQSGPPHSISMDHRSDRLNPLSIDTGNVDDDVNRNDDDDSMVGGTPFDERILEIVGTNPCKVYPARLVSELGLSSEDANAELCGLLAAVGPGATFTFEKLGQSNSDAGHSGSATATATATATTMVFSFPPDFATKARRARRRRDFQDSFRAFLTGAVKFLKVLTAFGLILSLLIVSVAALLGLVAAIVALSRGGGDHRQRNALLSRAHTVFYTMRQLLWCYAMFGDNFEGQDPFLSEIAYDLALVCSVFSGNPGSLWWWMNANRLSRRRNRMQRGWGSGFISQGRQGDGSPNNSNSNSSNDRFRMGGSQAQPLVRQRGVWGRDEDNDNAINRTDGMSDEGADAYRGLLSVAVEFLFGPNPADPGPSESEKSRLRSTIIVDKCSKRTGGTSGSVSLRGIAPFVDKPGDGKPDSSDLLAECLAIVVNFQGIPEQLSTESGASGSDETTTKLDSRFVFPELLAESQYTTTYTPQPDYDNGSFDELLFQPSVRVVPHSQSRPALPTFLKERRFRLTNLEATQFSQCAILGTLNLVGVIWLGFSLSDGGVLAIFIGHPKVIAVLAGLAMILRLYAILFFALPLVRLAIVMLKNHYRLNRNEIRAGLARQLSEEGTEGTGGEKKDGLGTTKAAVEGTLL